MATKKNRRLYRYGICLNNSECSKAKAKEVQRLSAITDFECEECHKKLKECPEPKSFGRKYRTPLIVAGLLAVVAGTSPLWLFNGAKPDYCDTIIGDFPDNEKTESPRTDSKKEPEQSTKDTQKPKPKGPTVSFGTYSGPASGLDGEIRVTRYYSLDLRNAAHETIELEPGDVITNTKFKDNQLVSGRWRRGTESRTFHR